jgi:hypothetical protein
MFIPTNENQFEFWKMRRYGISNISIANRMGITRRGISRALHIMDDKIDSSLQEMSQTNRIQIEKIDVERVVLFTCSGSTSGDEREMKLENVTIFLVIMAVLFAGCTGKDEPVVPEQARQTIIPVSTSQGTASVTSDLQPVTTVQDTVTSSPLKVFNGEYNWAEYRENNTITLPPNPRYQWEYVIKNERSAESFMGIPAIHEKITLIGDHSEWVGEKLITTKNGFFSIADLYFEKSTNRFLGGSRAITINGIARPEENIPADEQYSREDKPGYEMGITPFGEMDILLTDLGTESVTVPAGIYPDAEKYTGKFRDGSLITFWVSSGIPVPVQYQFQNRYLGGDDPVQTFELSGWG